ncbi:MAG: chromosome segregation ATPase [Cyanobacteria bacterium J06648_10]
MTSKYNDPNGPSERPTNFGSAKGSSSEGPEVRPEVRPEIRPKMGPKAGSKIDPQAGQKAGPQLPRTISQRPAQRSNQRSQPPQQRSLIYDVPLTGRSSNRAPSYAPPQPPSTASATPRTAPLADTDSDFPVQLPLYKRIPASLLGMRWLRSWPLVMLILFGIVGSAGTMAVVSLFRIPNLPNCRAIFWPTASASLRLQCAESYAAQGDVQNLLAAIALVDELPEDHPLRSDIINDRIEDWATLVLDLAERSFEEGDLENAIESARKIPARTAAAAVVEDRIQRWQTIWKAGEEGFNTAVDKVKEKDFQSAFTLSVVLLDVDNKYWSTEKYNELTKLISLAREDSRRLSEALGLADEGTLKGFREALKKLREIGEESVFFAEAQGERKNIAREMLESSEALLADRQLSEAQSMLNAIPRDTGLDAEVADFQIFVTAYQQAWAGNANGLENAINRMKTIRRDRPAYGKAQRLIAQWEGELQDVAVLNQARERASRGSTADLTAAISMAGRISQNSAQWPEAADQIGEWQVRVETAQDRPILDRADQLARPGTPDSLRAAIQEARKVSSRRTLGPEADRRIATWTGRIQRIEDQPLLDQARQRATTGDRAGAIVIASRIGEGRALYDTAQADIGRWQTQENGRARLGEAITTAQRGDANSLSAAIGIANQVPAGSDSRARADSQINRWSWDLLRQAESASGRNIETAIALASQIPSQAEAYEPAQVRIRNWQATLREIEASRRPASGATPAEPVELDENGLPIDLDLAPAEE